MIKLNESDIDKTIIEEIYDPKGETFSKIRKCIKDHVASTNILTRNVLEKWFFDNPSTKSEPSDEKIYQFLTSQTPEYWIEQYGKIVCKTLWGDEKFYDAFLRYKAVAEEAAKIKDLSKEKKLELIKTIITDELISKDIFIVAVKTDKSVYRPLYAEDLQLPIKRGSLCASDNRILSLGLRPENHQIIEKFKEECEKTFNYTEFSRLNRDKVLNAFRIEVCPYCNRQYITSWGTEENNHNTADIDHFYFKDRYPFLAVSFYNFIPSCQICNSRFKLTADFYATPHVNPFKNGFGQDAWFEVDNLEAVIDNDEKPDLSIQFNPGAEEAKRSAETFHLKELYRNHQDYAQEVIKKTRMFSETQIDEYLTLFADAKKEDNTGAKKRNRTLFSSRGELYRTIYGNYLEENEQGKRPLSKLTQDLLRNLGVKFDKEEPD